MTNKPVILCIDDEKDVLDKLQNILLKEFKAEYDIELAESGMDGLEIYQECCEDNIDIPLVISDFIMPGMKGDELLIELHNKDPDMVKILLTGQATLEGVKNVYENAGLYRYLNKPWENHDFIITIKEALKSYHREKNLVHTEEKYKRIFDRAVDGIFQTTVDGNILVMNRAMAAILGYESPDEGIRMIDKVQDMYVHQSDRDNFLNQLYNNKSPVEFEAEFFNKDKDIIWCEIHAGPVFNNKGDIEIIEGFARDITEKKLAQKQLEFYAQERERYLKELEQIVDERTKEIQEKNKELQRLSIIDRLTGLYNRHKLDEVLQDEYDRTLRYGNVFSLVIVDIDSFKLVNDTHGHQVGDTIIVELGNILINSIRKVDTVGRWGGEEFIIICPETPLNGAISIAEKIRTKVENFEFPVVSHKTISQGVACFKEGDTIENLIKRADECLYKAKNNGRNRVEYEK